VLTTSETYPWSFVTQLFHNGPPSHDGDRKAFRSDDFNLLQSFSVVSSSSAGLYILYNMMTEDDKIQKHFVTPFAL
jgi:hypothetical protein